MKIGTDSVICRIVEADSLISVTHTSKDPSGRRISDIHSVADLLQTLPSLTAPIIEAIPYEADYYDKWARVSRRDAASRASVRPVTVTVKSWTLLHSVPTAPQSSIDAPVSPRRQPAGSNSHKASISSCKSLDSIIDHYNKLFPNETEQGTKCNLKVPKHKDRTTKSHERGTEKHNLNYKQPNSVEHVAAPDNLTPNSSHHVSRNNKSASSASSPKRRLSVSPSLDRSTASPDRSAMADKSSKKNTLQVPLPTGLVCIQWPSALPASDNCNKTTQFPTCSPKKNSNQIIPRIKTPDLHHREQDASPSQINNKVVARQMEELKLMRISSSSLVASHNSRRHSFERRPDNSTGYSSVLSPEPRSVYSRRYSTQSNVTLTADNITGYSPGLSPEPRSAYSRRYSTQSNVTLTTDDTIDCRPTCVHEYHIGDRDTISAGRKCNSEDRLHPRERKCTLNVPIDILVPINNSSREVSQERNQEPQRASTNTENQSYVATINSEKGPKSFRKKRSKSRKFSHDDTKHSPVERERSSKSCQPKQRRNGPPMVQFLDLKDLQAIFDKAAKVRRPSEILSEEVCSLQLSM